MWYRGSRGLDCAQGDLGPEAFWKSNDRPKVACWKSIHQSEWFSSSTYVDRRDEIGKKIIIVTLTEGNSRKLHIQPLNFSTAGFVANRKVCSVLLHFIFIHLFEMLHSVTCHYHLIFLWFAYSLVGLGICAVDSAEHTVLECKKVPVTPQRVEITHLCSWKLCHLQSCLLCHLSLTGSSALTLRRWPA